MLIASSSCTEDQLEWCGLIESKVRHLIGNLERNPHISLAHVNPDCYADPTGGCLPPAESTDNGSADGEGQTTTGPASMWFIGLEFIQANVNLNLTYDIQHFTSAGILSYYYFALF